MGLTRIEPKGTTPALTVRHKQEDERRQISSALAQIVFNYLSSFGYLKIALADFVDRQVRSGAVESSVPRKSLMAAVSCLIEFKGNLSRDGRLFIISPQLKLGELPFSLKLSEFANYDKEETLTLANGLWQTMSLADKKALAGELVAEAILSNQDILNTPFPPASQIAKYFEGSEESASQSLIEYRNLPIERGESLRRIQKAIESKAFRFEIEDANSASLAIVPL